MKYIKIFAMVLISIGILAACQSTKENTVDEDGTELSDEMKQEINQMENSLKDFQERLKTKISEIDNDLADASDEAKIELNKQKDKFQNYLEDVDNRLERFSKESANNWEAFKEETKDYIENLKREFSK